jgi:signal peptidase II
VNKDILRRPWFWFFVAAIVILLDQLTKHWVVAVFEEYENKVFTSFFQFTLRYNTGAAFSFLADAGGWQRWFFSGMAIIASVVFSVWIIRCAKQKPLEAFAIAFILGGALGNLYDRILLGKVVDFIVVHYEDYYFPAFNLADSAITLGAVVIIFDIFLSREKSSHA